jgi:hypothetical protein
MLCVPSKRSLYYHTCVPDGASLFWNEKPVDLVPHLVVLQEMRGYGLVLFFVSTPDRRL